MENKNLEKKEKINIKKSIFIWISSFLIFVWIFMAWCWWIYTFAFSAETIFTNSKFDADIVFWIALPSLIWWIFLIYLSKFIKNKFNKK